MYILPSCREHNIQKITTTHKWWHIQSIVCDVCVCMCVRGISVCKPVLTFQKLSTQINASLFIWVVYHERLESLDKMTTHGSAGIMCIKGSSHTSVASLMESLITKNNLTDLIFMAFHTWWSHSQECFLKGLIYDLISQFFSSWDCKDKHIFDLLFLGH